MSYLYIIMGIFLLAAIITPIILLNNKQKPPPKLALPKPSPWPENFTNKETFSNENLDNYKEKLIIKKSNPIYKNIHIFCNDNTKDMTFYFIDKNTKEQFYSNLYWENFTFYIKVYSQAINKYIIDIKNYNVLLTMNNSVWVGNEYSKTYNIGINTINNGFTDYKSKIFNDFINEYKKSSGGTIRKDYVNYFLMINDDPDNKILNYYFDDKVSALDGFIYLVNKTTFINLIDVLFNCYTNRKIEDVKNWFNYLYDTDSSRINSQTVLRFNSKFNLNVDSNNIKSIRDTEFNKLNLDSQFFVKYFILNQTSTFTFYLKDDYSGIYCISGTDYMFILKFDDKRYLRITDFAKMYNPNEKFVLENLGDNSSIKIINKNYIKYNNKNYYKNIAYINFYKELRGKSND